MTLPLCTLCHAALDAEEAADPRQTPAGALVCDACYHEACEEPCMWCEEYYDTPDTCDYIVVLDHEAAGVALPGFYEILAAPFYAQPLLGTGFILPWAVRWLGYLPAGLAHADRYACGSLCPACEEEALEHVYWRQCAALAALS